MNREPDVIYEDGNIIGIHKPSGLMVHGVSGHVADEQTLVDFLLKKYPEIAKVGDEPVLRPGIVHRLDKDTSGVMVVARTQESFDALKNIFQEHKVKKTYYAIIKGIPKEKKGIIYKPIGIKTGSVKRSVHSGKMAKEAVTEYEVEKEFLRGDEKFALVKVVPQTGRTHQIRVHLASIGYPVIGDPLYGGKSNAKLFPRQALHAYSLEFTIPEALGRRRLMLSADIPDDMKHFLDSLDDLDVAKKAKTEDGAIYKGQL